MKPVAFKYFAPHTVDDALDLLATHGDEGKILAGGQSLVPDRRQPGSMFIAGELCSTA